MYHGLSSKVIDSMHDTEVIEYVTFIEQLEEAKTKKLAYEIAKATWGGK